jgi:class 3 adenylate cyclase
MGDERMPVPAEERRVTDAERDRTIELLRAATVDGSLDLDELSARIEDAYRARTAGELALVTRDLPAAQRQAEQRQVEQPAARQRRSVWRNGGFRWHATSWGLVNGFLVGVWAMAGGGHFWPFYPAAGWGIAVGMHAMAASSFESRRAVWARRLRAGQPPPALGVPRVGQRRPGGSRPVPRAVGPVQRVAVLFTDVAGSTQLTAALGDAGWSQVRERHRALLARCVRGHHGTEVNSAGDGILARFRTELDAVRCAVDIQRALEQQRVETGFAPGVRIGIHAGEAVADGHDLVGHVINLAARVTAEAEPGEVLVTEGVAERLGDRFPVTDRGLRHLKGVAQPRHLLAVDWR